MEKLENFFSDNYLPTHAKIGIYGGAGTGKTRTAFEIVKGLYKDKNMTKPVVFFDTEKGSDWLLPLFSKENIKCLVKKSRSFVDLIKAVEIAEQQASFMIIDSISHVWRELCESYLRQYNADRKAALEKKYSKDWAEKNFKPALKLEFQHWNQIKPTWGKFTERYLNSDLNMIVCGRAGDIYDYQEDENGKKELIKSGTRMATEKELSYEPSLLIELQRRSIDGKDKLFAVIEKDRSDTIQGHEFELVKYSDLKPHFDFIQIGGKVQDVNFTKNQSGILFEGTTIEPYDEFTIEKKNREIVIEEIKGLLELKFPGTSSENKKIKNELFFEVFNSNSWTKLEQTNSTELKVKLEDLRKIISEK